MKRYKKPHDWCEFKAILVVWKECKDRSAEWTREYLRIMAVSANSYLRGRKP